MTQSRRDHTDGDLTDPASPRFSLTATQRDRLEAEYRRVLTAEFPGRAFVFKWKDAEPDRFSTQK